MTTSRATGARQIAPNVSVITAPNPGPKTLEGTNCYLVGRERQIIVDAGPDLPAFQRELAHHVTSRDVTIVLTHDHPDHAGGAAYLATILEAPLWMSGAGGPRRISGARPLGPDQELPVDGGLLRAVHAPGHSWDHVCFFLEPEKTLFTGDVILGRGTTLIALPEGDVSVYLQTLERLKSLQAAVIAPGHGPVVECPARTIEEYIEHRRRREAALLTALVQPRSIPELVEEVYAVTDPEVRRLAELSVEAQLAKLLRESKVSRGEDGDYRVRADS